MDDATRYAFGLAHVHKLRCERRKKIPPPSTMHDSKLGVWWVATRASDGSDTIVLRLPMDGVPRKWQITSEEMEAWEARRRGDPDITVLDVIKAYSTQIGREPADEAGASGGGQ